MASAAETPKPNDPERKLALEIEKLELEKRNLDNQLSPRGRLLDLLKAASVPIAILGAFVSLYIGTRQSDEAREKRLTDGYASAFTQLSSADPRLRISAAMRLNLFLPEAARVHQGEILSSAIGALAVEDDLLVQDALVNVLNKADVSGVSRESLSNVLALAVQLDRSLVSRSLAQIEPRRDEKGNLAFEEKTHDLGLPHALQLLAGPEKMKDFRRIKPLIGLSRAIDRLVAEGARATSFTHIYCERCDFRPLREIEKADFSGSILPDARFDNMVLKGANFREAHFSATRFTGTDLERADFTHDAEDDSDYGETKPPIFACADLRGAVLDGLLLLHQETSLFEGDDGPTAELTLVGVRLDHARIDATTRLDRLRLVHRLMIAPEALKSNEPDARVRNALNDLAFRAQAPVTGTAARHPVTVAWEGDDSYNQRDTITLPLDDNALWSGIYLSVASVYRYAADNRIGEIEHRFRLLARNVNSTDAFFSQPHGHWEGSAACTPGKAVATPDYGWYIYTDFDTSADAEKFLAAPFNPMDPIVLTLPTGLQKGGKSALPRL